MLTIHRCFTTLVAFSCVLLTSCTPGPAETLDSPFCAKGTDVNESCHYEVGESSFWLLSSNLQMPVERPVQLTLRSEKPLHIEASELRGLSMYMGRVPLVWEQVSKHEWQATLQLGACTDPDMRWQLRLSLATEKGSHQWQLPFSSTQP